ncbi:MAG: hypothetical protein IJ735_05575 [Clostridia bacterium]|nr:hypothetical protein [Clostridia bacterium]
MDKVDKKLRRFQQAELDAMVMYRGLADRMKEERDAIFLKKIAAEEGRHAAVLRGLTCETLQCKQGTKRAVLFMHFFLRRDLTFRVISWGERAAGKKYERFVDKYGINELLTVAHDEYDHAIAFGALATKEQ